MDQNIQNPYGIAAEPIEPAEVPTNPKGKFSFIWGIVGCAVSVVLYIASIALMGAGAAIGSSMTPWIIVTLVISIAFLILSIFTLIAGIKGIRINPRTKAIIGTAFSGQNLLMFIVITVICFIALAASNISSSSYTSDPYGDYHDYSDDYDDIDDLYDDIYDF